MLLLAEHWRAFESYEFFLFRQNGNTELDTYGFVLRSAVTDGNCECMCEWFLIRLEFTISMVATFVVDDEHNTTHSV